MRTESIASFGSKWCQLTNDPNILDIVYNCHIDFGDSLPVQNSFPREIVFSYKEALAIDVEIDKFLSKGFISESTSTPEDFISNIFVREKSSGGFRIILNLSSLNKFVNYEHFKMESLDFAISLISKDCFLASVDLKDAYYSISIAREHRRFLKFYWRGILYHFSRLPMGLACAPRFFTKLLKPVFSALRSFGFLSVIYIDDTLANWPKQVI